ncbi:anhydro-N-acetylmuramic acid kinase [Sediminibacterium ginsengisoli]|uniref:Anhydro-N-acetylmuramic acid kinase n=1 Tax=Sediminibacterium ginsengisoli TaxID=413434 RepID=A0A1T4JZR7_9BACT|nr:anhydro-N-acetylmuramic acid kinase [Sediminibacterium ginsengisoli]SJZ35525.1 anhydro-N-acetylmuramic acid kinase [Sediminibacterium ginsengisoli]
MNRNIAALYGMAGKPSRLIIGLMSGTSVDGLDIALCRISGNGMNTQIRLEAFQTMSYEPGFKEQIKSIFSRRDADLEKVCVLNAWVGLEHARLINECLQRWKVSAADVDLVASHGQTIYHAPKFLHPEDMFGNATLQIGDGDHIAVATGIITISDFRQKHIAAGGEGAPLAVYGDYLIFSSNAENRIMLNIGGIANFTYLPSSRNASEVFSTDVGTGNTLMDAYIQQHFHGKYFDENAAVAGAGNIHAGLLHELKQHIFFSNGFPKTIGPELFNLAYLSDALSRAGLTGLSHEDVMATLNRFSADMIVDAIQRTLPSRQEFVVYTSGGGMHNPLLMAHIKEQLPGIVFRTTDELAINPDAKEAVLFAILANETICGGQEHPGANRNGIPSVTMGKISFPW